MKKKRKTQIISMRMEVFQGNSKSIIFQMLELWRHVFCVAQISMRKIKVKRIFGGLITICLFVFVVFSFNSCVFLFWFRRNVKLKKFQVFAINTNHVKLWQLTKNISKANSFDFGRPKTTSDDISKTIREKYLVQGGHKTISKSFTCTNY